ncbi:hypothetical protein G9F32_03130 [Acinetobacter sp. 194]|uniref:hypothetical protein n=1 Tax=Acinetobacter shaoyimingii TaxID=2715164 RepID=UPI00140B182D|nr:hypothetical protein [Acinetobacter shaoyimingii]NHB57026.1 hypothetical protein [Acinetobacter shaoyimingii]
MHTEEQIQDVLLDVKFRVGEWVGETLCTGAPPRWFEALYKIFQLANVELKTLSEFEPIKILEITRDSAKSIGLSEIETAYAVDNWACDASKLLGLTQNGYPQEWR